MRLMNWYWVVWAVVLFGVPEFIALKTGHPEYTLSDTVWRIFSVEPGQGFWQWKASHFLLASFMLWVNLHFVFRILR